MFYNTNNHNSKEVNHFYDCQLHISNCYPHLGRIYIYNDVNSLYSSNTFENMDFINDGNPPNNYYMRFSDGIQKPFFYELSEEKLFISQKEKVELFNISIKASSPQKFYNQKEEKETIELQVKQDFNNASKQKHKKSGINKVSSLNQYKIFVPGRKDNCVSKLINSEGVVQNALSKRNPRKKNRKIKPKFHNA